MKIIIGCSPSAEQLVKIATQPPAIFKLQEAQNLLKACMTGFVFQTTILMLCWPIHHILHSTFR